jgi:pimeloyl-ACP methyl ester carboxylesterase
VEGLKAIPITTLQSRNQADEILAKFIPEIDVRQFLLKNLSRKPEGGFTWKINLPVIDKNLKMISADLQFPGIYQGQTLFVRGARSNYVKDEDRQRIKELFPNSTLITMETGHWVQAEKPQEFVEVVKNFLANTK